MIFVVQDRKEFQMEKVNEIDILKEKLLYAIGKYSDYKRYAVELDNIEEEYDETLEIYHYDIWEGESGGTIVEKAQEILQVATEIFEDLRENAESELFYTMEEIVQLDKDSQMEILGIFIERNDFTEEVYEDMIDRWEEFPYNQIEAQESFLNYLKEYVNKEERRDVETDL